ncbi:MAG: hypothetical protein ABR548_13270 [Actinomycetota bacterium]|nr:hypothetical protein [Actinomycetota bacterium]
MSPLKAHPLTRLFVVIVPLAAAMSGCVTSSCRVTVTRARAASAIDVTNVARSGILEARLTFRGHGLPGKEIVFRMPRRDFVVAGEQHLEEVGAGQTDTGGVATLDLKRAFPTDFAQDATASYYEAFFEGDHDFCRSNDREEFRFAQIPDGSAGSRALMPVRPALPQPLVIATPNVAPLPAPADGCLGYVRRVFTNPLGTDTDKLQAKCA